MMIIERYQAIKAAVSTVKNLGIIDLGRRREAVIHAVSAQEKNILKINSEDASEIQSVANLKIDEEPDFVKADAINKYFELKEGDNNVPVVVEALHGVSPAGEDYTREIATAVAEKTGAALLIAKKSRNHTDSNRAWWVRKDGVREYSRSIRAALYWSIKKVVDLRNLMQNGELSKNFWRFSIHGMKDNANYDIAIAASHNPADQNLLNTLVAKLAEDTKLRVVLAREEDASTADYSGLPSTAHFRNYPTKVRDFHHPPFGNKFQTIQMEIGRKHRIDSDKRALIIDALTKFIVNINIK